MTIEVEIVNTSDAILYSNTTQPFVILNLIGNYFLLTKASPNETFGKNINFKVNDKEFYSTFLRHVNLPYAGKLSELIENLSIMNSPKLQHHWLLLYEIHDFEPQKLSNYRIGIPPYGDNVLIHMKGKGKLKSRVSNLFKLNSEAFYFMDCSPSCCNEFSIITNENCDVLYGLTYFVKDVTVCLPFHSIGSEKLCPMNILQSIKPLLEGTCYVFYGGSYCTGFVLDQQTIVSARHMLPFEDQKIGIEVGVRFYPFHEERIGHVERVGQGSVDVVVVSISDKILVKNQTAEMEKGASLCKKINDKDLIGKPILALGFGKYGFSPRLFHRVEVAMPTIENGIVSKVIHLRNSNTFIKTDAVLYNGFSGCGIWMGAQLIGMAVFILKNKTNHSNFNHHNFSYSVNFILELLNKNKNEELVSEINGELRYFDKIQTRHKLALLPKL